MKHSMTLTKRWLRNQDACSEAYEAFCSQKETDLVKILRLLIRKSKDDSKYLDWVNWLIVRKMTYKQYVAYAVYAARQVLSNFETIYPDKRPRQAIEAAEACLKRNTKKNRLAAWSAARSAAEAAWSPGSAAGSAARSAAEAAWSAESAARLASRSEVWLAAEAAWSPGSAAELALQKKILRYGIRLLTASPNPKEG